MDVNLSEQTLISCSSAGNCSGGYVNTAADFVRDTGLPLDSCFPYTATNSTCASACANWSTADYRSAGWHWVATTAPTVESLKSAITTYGPVVTTMDVYSDFYSYVSGVYSYVSGTYQGGHAVVIVGYDDPGQYFIVKNSWGTGWGMSGYFLIAYSQLTSAVNFGYYTIADEGYSPVGPAPACTFSLSPTGKTFRSTGGTGTILVSSQDNCSWTGVSNVSWISIKAGNTGSGNGSVSYSVAANPYRTQRTGTLTIAGQTFTVIQNRVGK
ncbi:MAG: C39 family peptidase [Deltaproteobacteria bacterium]|nr:C39 family peptidase [Deltaproteobacteria bacterium]